MTHYHYQIYRLIDPRYSLEDENYVRYVGRTRHDLKVRLSDHWGLRNDEADPKSPWLRDLASLGLKPEIQLVETLHLPICSVASIEGDWTERHQRVGYKLLNVRLMNRVAFPNKVHDPIEARRELDASTEESKTKTKLHIGLTEHIQWRNTQVGDLEQAVLDKIDRGEIDNSLVETLKKTIGEAQSAAPAISIANDLDNMPALKTYLENIEKYGDDHHVFYLGKEPTARKREKVESLKEEARKKGWRGAEFEPLSTEQSSSPDEL